MGTDTWPKDKHKPKCPYVKGAGFKIRRHVPPAPFCNRYSRESMPREMVDPGDIPKVTQTDYCFQSGLIDTPPHEDTKTHRLVITEEISSGDGRGKQAVRCSLDGGKQQYVAKIYDPLYYRTDEESVPGHDPLRWVGDLVYMADEDYSTEAAAYEEAHKAGVDGQLVPAYHGSWTFEVARRATKTRPRQIRHVRLILLEWIPNTKTMNKLGYEFVRRRIPPQHRLDILARVVETHAKLIFHGVQQEDLASRNVLLVMPDDITTQLPGVFLIDLDLSVVFSRPNCEVVLEKTDKPVSPRWEGLSVEWDQFSTWLPEPHWHSAAAVDGWLRRHWEGNDEFSEPAPDSVLWMKENDRAKYAKPLWDKDVEEAMVTRSATSSGSDE